MKKNIEIDKDIVKRAQSGNLKAFEQIVFHYEKPVLSFILRMVYKMEDAEDLAQETFIKIYKKICKYKPAYKFSTWVFAIAKNTVFDWMRKQKRAELLIIDDQEKPFESFYLSKKEKELIDQRNNKIDIENALKRIRPIYKSVITLFYIQGFNYKEIAEMKKIPLNTVKTYIYRAKLILKKQLC